MMSFKTYVVRVTRDDGEYVDIDVETMNWDEAKVHALEKVKDNPGLYFMEFTPTYRIDPMDDDATLYSPEN